MTVGPRCTFVAALFSAAALPAQAQDTVTALQRCREIIEPLTRVACYDAVPLAPTTLRTPESAVVTGQMKGAAGAQRTADALPAATAVTSPLTEVNGTSSLVAAAAASAESGFGRPVQPATATQDALESTIDGLFDGWVSETRFTFANGQVWRINDGSTAAYAARRDAKVRITRGLLGSYFMQVEGVSQMPRVKRVK